MSNIQDESKKFCLKRVPTTKLVKDSIKYSIKTHMKKDITVPPSNHGDDLYALLGVKKDATDHDLKLAYRKLALKYHPDKTGNDEAAADYFQKISRAYHILIDPHKRRIYNDYGLQGIKLMESCGTQNEKAFRIISNKWFIGLMGVLACLTCCCFGCCCCFFCCNFCCGKFNPNNDYNSDEEDIPLYADQQTISYDKSKL